MNGMTVVVVVGGSLMIALLFAYILGMFAPKRATLDYQSLDRFAPAGSFEATNEAEEATGDTISGDRLGEWIPHHPGVCPIPGRDCFIRDKYGWRSPYAWRADVWAGWESGLITHYKPTGDEPLRERIAGMMEKDRALLAEAQKWFDANKDGLLASSKVTDITPERDDCQLVSREELERLRRAYDVGVAYCKRPASQKNFERLAEAHGVEL